MDEKVVPDNTRPSNQPLNWLDAVERASRVISIFAIPVVLAVGGWMIQRQLQDQTVSRDYVQLAVTILENPDKSKVPPELREWAVDLLNDNSPTKLNAKAKESLRSGATTLPSFRFVPSSALTPDLQGNLEASLEDFQKYLVGLGFNRNSESPVSVEISPGIGIKTGDGENWVAHWESATSSVRVASAFANDEDLVLRQLAHQFLLPNGEISLQYRAIESGLASYFACSFTGNPVVGGEGTEAGQANFPPEDLRNSRPFSQVRLDQEHVETDGSEIWGGAFWQVRQILGQQKADRLLAETWRTFSPEEPGSTSVYGAFATDLVKRSGSADGEMDAARIPEVFKQRGLSF
jgi:hypothetical protein